MSSTIVSLAAFGCTVSAGLAAIVLRGRLPAHHFEGDSKEFVKLVLGLIATITALVLGLLISSAHSAFDAQEAELQRLGVHLYQIDRGLAHFGSDALQVRGLLRQIAAGDVGRVWPEGGISGAAYAPMSEQEQAEQLFDGIAGLVPKTEMQRLGQSRALQLLSSVGEARRLLGEQSQGTLSWPFLIVLVSWLTVLFFGFGLFARFNATVVASLFVGSLSVAGAIFLIIEMNQPYGGWIQVSAAPLRDALAQMGR